MPLFVFIFLCLFSSFASAAGNSFPTPSLSQLGAAANDLSNVGNVAAGRFTTNLSGGRNVENLNASLGRVLYVDQFPGVYHDGTHDDLPAFNLALAQCAAKGGGTVEIGPYQYQITSGDLVIPSGCHLHGRWHAGGERTARNYTSLPYTLAMNSAYSIKDGGESAAISHLIVIRQGMTIPNSMRTGIQAVQAFAGTAVMSQYPDFMAEDILIIGFDQCVNVGNERPYLIDVKGDCNSGLYAHDIHDVGKFTHVEFWPFLTTHAGWTFTSLSVSGAVNNGSGLYRVTLPTSNGLITGDQITIDSGSNVPALNGRWNVTVVDATHVDLQGSSVAPTATASYTSGFVEVTLSAASNNIVMGQGVTGPGIPNGTTVKRVAHIGNRVFLSAAATSTQTAAALTFSNPTYSSGGSATIDTTYRKGYAFNLINSEGAFFIDPFAFGYSGGFFCGTGCNLTTVIGLGIDGWVPGGAPDTTGIILSGNAQSNTFVGGYIGTPGTLVVDNVSTIRPNMLSGMILTANSNYPIQIAAGDLAITGGHIVPGAPGIVNQSIYVGGAAYAELTGVTARDGYGGSPLRFYLENTGNTANITVTGSPMINAPGADQ